MADFRPGPADREGVRVRSFVSLDLQGFRELLRQYHFERRVDSIHLHHTWRPRRVDYAGDKTILGMWRYHTETNKWSDIAQHLTIAPDGALWVCRDWNRAPASATGYNGNSQVGPFMIEMIGDFDLGRDPFDGPQRESTVQVLALLLERFGLATSAIRFHNEMSSKTCPGSGVDRENLMAAVEAARATHGGSRELSFGPEAFEKSVAVDRARQSMYGAGERGPASAETEPAEETMSAEDVLRSVGLATSSSERSERGTDLSAGVLASLRPHLVNLTQGVLSTGGIAETTEHDVRAIFEEHLPAELQAAKARQEPLRILFFAHGGLNSEKAGLRLAFEHVDWWKKNGIYPIFFVWETGLLETVRQLLGGSREPGARDVWDHTTDRLVERLARKVGGTVIWGGMKRSAEKASDTGGGARLVASHLAQFCARERSGSGHRVELHAVGHSAGAIFHSHFIGTACRIENVPSFQSLSLLAPAARVDTFRALLGSQIGPGLLVERATIFTMMKELERADNCVGVYRKSLLYLIHHALEADEEAPILGLETSLRADAGLRALFGLGFPGAHGDVVWSRTTATSGKAASTSTTHGGFDDDPPTMNGIVERILSRPPLVPLPEPRAGRDIDEMPEERRELEQILRRGKDPSGTPGCPPSQTPPAKASTSTGRRRALCVGINEYPGAELHGCVNDARSWARTLGQSGFETELLLDGAASREGILRALRQLLASARTGDHVIFQFAGHGVSVPDLNGDEHDGKDEALCPIDFREGRLLLDDDLGDCLDAAPSGVSMTAFIDCCHSGTISRFGLLEVPAAPVGRDVRARFVVADENLLRNHERFRAGLSHRSGRRALESAGREVLYAACLPSEVAYESEGQGDFTRIATRLLPSALERISNERFQQQLSEAFGSGARQHPDLTCRPGSRSALFLALP